MKTKYILLVAIGTVLFSCGNSSEEKAVAEEKKEEVIAEPKEHHHEEEALVLNNGEKWVVVPEMMTFIRNMEAGVNDFEKNETPISNDYVELAQLIDVNIRELTSNCTMEGQAHDELHKWLVPFIELSKQFDVATEIDEQENIYHQFKAAYKEFNIYFE